VTQGRAYSGRDGAVKRSREAGGRPRLSTDDLQQLAAYLSRGAETYEFLGVVCTRARVDQAIEREFDFYLPPATVRTYAPQGQTPELRYRYWERDVPPFHGKELVEEGFQFSRVG